MKPINKRVIGIGLMLFVIIAIPVILSFFSPVKQQVPKISKNTATPPANFSYNIAKAQQALDKFVKDNLKEEFIPSKIEIEQRLTGSGVLNGGNNHFGANWKIKNDIFNISLDFINNSNSVKDVSLFATIPDMNNFIANETSVTTIINIYFKTTPKAQDFTCGSFEKNTSFCENFKISETGKTGWGVIKGQNDQGVKILAVFSCFFPKNDSYYLKRTSCLLFREKDPRGL